MVVILMVNFKQIIFKDKVFMYGAMGGNFKANEKIIKCMDRGIFYGLMGDSI